jgi:hypothetical protein
MLDRFAALGRPVHITEIMIPSGAAEFRERFHWKPLQGWTTTAEGEARQARETELLYRQLFAHPAVKAITWWDLTDAFACLGIPCGLLRRNGAPKPAYERLQRLIHEEWRSSGTIATDERGKACAEGYAGHYTVVAEVNGTRLRGRFHLGDRGDESPIRVDMERP